MIPAAEVLRIARLARLELSPQEAAGLGVELGSILAHMSVLRGAVEQHENVGTEIATPTRSDLAGADPLQLPVAELSAASTAGFFTVPRLAAMESAE